MTFDLKKWHTFRVHICLACFAIISGILNWLLYRIIWINSCLGVMNSIAKFSFCTHLTFDLILRLRRISRLGIHPYSCWHTSMDTISMDATFYSILPSKDLFSWNGLPTGLVAICWERAYAWLSACAVLVYAFLSVCVLFPSYVLGRKWNSFVSVPDHCLFVFLISRFTLSRPFRVCQLMIER